MGDQAGGSGQAAGSGGGKRSMTALLVVLSCAVVLALGSFLYRSRKAAGGPAGGGMASTDGAPAATQNGPSATAASLNADAVKDWTPPKFAARQAERDQMAGTIRDYYNLEDDAVLAAMRTVPRHEFVPADEQNQAYADTPLPIANGQLISQPWIVAFMTSELHLGPDSKVLEIGTGSGYQAAVLTNFTRHVYTIEIIKSLADAAAARLARLGYTVVHAKTADGFYGWPEAAPFDAIIVTCAAGQIPPPLIQQLKPGGRMMIPVGSAFAMQSLMLVEKDEDGKIHSQSMAPVRFVPLVQKDSEAHDNAGK